MNRMTNFIVKNQNSILVGTGIAGFIIGGAVSAVNAIKYHKATNGVDMTKKEKAKAIVKYGSIPLTLYGLSTFSILKGFRNEQRKAIFFASSLATSEALLTNFSDKVMKQVGDDVGQKLLNESVAEVKPIPESVKAEPKLMARPYDFDPDKYDYDDVECYDEYTGRRWISSKNKIEAAVNELNQERLSNFNEEVSLNDYFDLVGLDRANCGDDVGWDASTRVEVRLGRRAREVNGIPLLSVEVTGMKCLRTPF